MPNRLKGAGHTVPRARLGAYSSGEERTADKSDVKLFICTVFALSHFQFAAAEEKDITGFYGDHPMGQQAH